MSEIDNRDLCAKAQRHVSKTTELDAQRQVNTRAGSAQLRELRRLAARHKKLTDLLVRLLSRVD